MGNRMKKSVQRGGDEFAARARLLIDMNARQFLESEFIAVLVTIFAQ
jgi:hypothetical protein